MLILSGLQGCKDFRGTKRRKRPGIGDMIVYENIWICAVMRQVQSDQVDTLPYR